MDSKLVYGLLVCLLVMGGIPNSKAFWGDVLGEIGKVGKGIVDAVPDVIDETAKVGKGIVDAAPDVIDETVKVGKGIVDAAPDVIDGTVKAVKVGEAVVGQAVKVGKGLVGNTAKVAKSGKEAVMNLAPAVNKILETENTLVRCVGTTTKCGKDGGENVQDPCSSANQIGSCILDNCPDILTSSKKDLVFSTFNDGFRKIPNCGVTAEALAAKVTTTMRPPAAKRSGSSHLTPLPAILVFGFTLLGTATLWDALGLKLA